VIKVLKLSNKSVTRFKTNKKWNYSTLDSGSNIVLEQGDNIPLFSSSINKLSTEQNNSEFKLNLRVGKKVTGTFFSKDSKYFNAEKEPLNYDGSYQRVVYNSIKHLFYNDYGTVGDIENDSYYKNPINIFGSETGIYSPQNFSSKTLEVDKRSERRVMSDEVTVLEIPANVFGEKIKPGTLKIIDHSSEFESIEIVDDGNTNLIVGTNSFNNISELNLNSFFNSISETSSVDQKINIDYTDLSYGYEVDSHGDFLLSGAPTLSTSISENQSGRASLHKFNPISKKHELVKNFYCPFTQNGLAHENRNDNCQFIITELEDVISTENFLVNDDFGKSVSINESICAIGSPKSHINGRNNDQPTGHIFIYEKNKGGKENWGIINVFEGTPDSDFGESISTDGDFIAVGSPNFENGVGCVYVFKKTKRTKEHPWIKTSSVYDSYQWNDVLSKYEGTPTQDTEEYSKYLKDRDGIISRRISKTIKELKKLLNTGVISDIEYINAIPTKDDYSEVYPYNYLYTDNVEECEDKSNWYNQKIWSKNTHPATRCKFAEDEKHYKKSSWPGYMTDEKTDLYIPNPAHEQNKDNKWAYRWKLQNVVGNAEDINLFGDNDDCELDNLSMFSNSNLNSFGDDSGFPLTEYSETPKESIGDTTYDLIGTIKSPDLSSKRFGEKVVIKGNKLYASTHTTDFPRCYMFVKTTNEHGCEVWELKNTISETELIGHTNNSMIDESVLHSVELNHYDTYFDIKICPSVSSTSDSTGIPTFNKWIYSFDQPILSSENKILGGTRVDACDSICKDYNSYKYYSRFSKIKEKQAAQIPANYGEQINLPMLNDKAKFFSKAEFADSFYHPSDNSIGISWKNARENVSFAYTNVTPGNFPNFMTIYSNEAKQSDGTYDPLHTLIEIGGHETLNNQLVRLIIDSERGNTEHFYEFIYRGSIEGTHYTLNELKEKIEYECTLPPNKGVYTTIANELFIDGLGNKQNAKLFSKGENDLQYSEPWSEENTMKLSWKNFREDVSFSYPMVKRGKDISIMRIYSNEAKNLDGSYNALNIIAEVHANETLNNSKVRLTLNTGFVNGDEYYYEFLYRGSKNGKNYTLNELKESYDYDCTLPPNQGEYVEIPSEKFIDPLNYTTSAKLYYKSEDTHSYIEPWSEDDAIGLSWKNFRENVSFSYPSVKRGRLPSFMAIYANEAKQDDGTFDPRYILAEIGAQETLNGETVRLTFNTGFVGGDEYFYEFIYRGSIEGTHYTLNELKNLIDKDYAETTTNSGLIRYIKDYENLNIFKKCRLPKFYSKKENQLSYVEPYSSDETQAISWKNFRENVSFSYPQIASGSEPSFMTIYSNGAKRIDGSYDPIFTLAEIGASDALNGKLVKLLIYADNCKNDKTQVYEFLYKGSIEGTHFTLSELRNKYDYECTLPPNLGIPVLLNKINENAEEDNLLFSKADGGLSYTEPYSSDDAIALSWKNFRENVSFSYPSVKRGNHPCFMAIYSNEAKQTDGTYDPSHILAEIGAQETLNGETVRLTFNTGFVGGDEYFYEFIYRGSIEGTHYTLNELKNFIEFDCTLPPNMGGFVSLSDKEFLDPLDNKLNAKFFSKGEGGLSYSEPWFGDDIINISWKNIRENVSFSYPSVKKGTSPNTMAIYANEAKQDDGTYDPLYTLAEIGAQETLNGETVRLTFNTGFVGGDEYFYEFIYHGSLQGTHYTINELKETIDYECILSPNQGEYVSLSKINFDDYLLNSDKAKFFTKIKNQAAFKQNENKDEVSISWKNFRENVSFSYPSVKSGVEPSFMTIYANGAKNKKGDYDPIKTLAEIGAEDTLNGNVVKLTFNQGSVNDDEFFYEFIYDGSLAGTHYTLNELMENNLLKKVESTTHIQKSKSNINNRFYVENLNSIQIETLQKKYTNYLTSNVNSKIKKIKSFGELPANSGHEEIVRIQIDDDILQSQNQIKFYSQNNYSAHSENSNLENEIEIHWKYFREGVSFYYPSIRKNDTNETNSCMRLYMDHDNKNGYDKNKIIAEIKTSSSLNGEIVRLNLVSNTNKEIFYEFLFDGTSIGTEYTLSELSEKVSPNLSKPLIINSPDLENCKIRIDKDKISNGLHKLYILLIDSDNQPIGTESMIEMYNNPIVYNLEPRRNLVKKSYTYSANTKSEFGKGIGASDKYFVVGNPSDRKYYVDQTTSYTAGSAFVFRVNETNLDFLEKIYGEDTSENNFSSAFGNDVSVLGSNFLVGSHSKEMTTINLNESGNAKKLDIEDLEFGATKYADEIYHTNEALITDYEIDLNSKIGDAVVKVKIDDLNINRLLINEMTLKANFIDTGNETLRVHGVTGENTEDINGIYRLVKSPINIDFGCDIDTNLQTRVYINKNNWSVFYDKLRTCWVLTDKPNISVEYEIPCNWNSVLETFERINLISEFNLLTEEMLTSAIQLYNVSNQDIISKWKLLTQTKIPTISVSYANLIRELESISKLKLNPQLIEEIFYLYSSNSRKRISTSILKRWKDSESNLGMLPFIYELDSVNPISLNFSLLVKTLDIYKLKDYEILKSWSVKLGYNHLLGDLLREIRPSYHDRLSIYNLRLLTKIATDFISQRKYSTITTQTDDCPEVENFILTEEELGQYGKKWKPNVDRGFLLSDVFKDINKNVNINFAISNETSDEDMPRSFMSGVGLLEDKDIKINSNNDTIGEHSSLTWGIYRDKTEIVGNYIHFYVNILPDVELDSTLVFVYNSIKSAINGYVYYYSINNDTNKCRKIKRMKTNKTKYSCKKQYGHSVSLSKNFISVGSPVLGNFNIDEISTFGGRSVVSFGDSEKLFIEYNVIPPTLINDFSKKIVGSIISYDHAAILDNKSQFIGNVFYKNGVIALTDRTGYFSELLSNSGTSGFELEFKSMHTLYENEILCKVEPHEFNFSTNPTSVQSGQISYDINQDGKFDIIDASYIFKYIMGEVGDIEITDDEIIENETSIKLSAKNKWPKQDLLMTESEDVLLMDLFFNSDIIENRPTHEKVISNLKQKYENGEFDINGDGKTDEVDANLLLRYFVGRRGTYLTRDLVSKYDNSTRSDANTIIKFLDEKTGKNLGREILKDFQDFSENDKQDSTGSYLAPYATTIGLYSGLELAMVAKLGKPVKILPNYPINFLIKFDN
tara:strand:+ start:25076 stop:34474 length:9399 start_codon:yes stop_codon:yes gene_type:complete